MTRQSITASVALGLVMLGQACAAQVEKDRLAESQRIVSQHKAVFDKMPLGLAPYSTDAILLGNGDIAMSISMEMKGASERFPDAAEVWNGIAPQILVCPTNDDLKNGYGFNGALVGAALSSIDSPTSTIMTGDAINGVAANGNIIADPAEYDRRHNKMFIAGFVDGHVKLIKDPPAPGEE